MPSQSQNASDSQGAYGSPLGWNNGNSGPYAIADLSKSLFQSFTLNQNATIGTPANPPGAFSRILLRLVQDATGSRTVTWSACWRDPPSLGSSGPAGSSAMMEFIFDGNSYQFVGGSTTFAVAGQNIYTGSGGVAVAGAQPSNSANTKITPTIGAVTVAGVATPGVNVVTSYIIPAPGGTLIRGEFPNASRP